MTFGHYTAHTAALTASLHEAARQVLAFGRRLCDHYWAHHFGGTPNWPVPPLRGEPDWTPWPGRVAAARRRRKAARKLHKRLRAAGRDKAGRPR